MHDIINKVKAFLNKYKVDKYISNILIPWNNLKKELNELNRTKEILCPNIKKSEDKIILNIPLELVVKYVKINIENIKPEMVPS